MQSSVEASGTAYAGPAGPARSDQALEPYLVRREPGGAARRWQLTGDRLTVGRAAQADLVLDGDPLVSRLHLTLERLGGVWTATDDGLSRNGTLHNGRRLTGRVALKDRDQLLVGGTLLTYCAPAAEREPPTLVGQALLAGLRLTDAQRAVLVALCRPCLDGRSSPTPATNQAIALELHLSIDAVKGHLRALCHLVGISDLPQNEKRARLSELAVRCGLVGARDV